MDLPPSGWYPDPYGTPRLLRWWDGSVWTQHTHPDESAGGAGTSGEQATAVASTAVQSAVLTATAGQASIGQATTGQASNEQPSTDRLRRTRPPTGQRTQPQPALPEDYQAAVAAVQAAALQATSVQPASVPPAALQHTTVQPLTVQPGYPQPAVMPAMSGADGSGTQVLYYGGGTWPPGPGGPGPGLPGGPGMPGGPGAPGNLYGYQEVQRRRRRWLIGGVGAGTAVAAAAIVLIAMNLGGSPAPAADQTKATPTAAAVTAPASASTSPSPSASASPSASPSATAAVSTLTDSQSGLTYAQLAAPWQAAGCPTSLNNGSITWTDGEYAVAGTVNGSTTWYGEACSGPLPAAYGYTGTTDLQSVTENLAQTFDNAYYSALAHNTSVETDQATSVGGHSAWAVTWGISYTNAAGQGATWTDEQAEVVVVDNGTSQPGVFFTSVPQNLNEANVSGLVSSLQLSSAAAAAPSATASSGVANANP